MQSFSTVNTLTDEAYSCRIFDGAGRLRAQSAHHPGSTGGYIGQVTTYDVMGRETNRSSNAAFQPKKFTSYTRDAIGSDEAMHRRYNPGPARFDQPDPYDGSYDLTDPQSFNRYAYVQNDPVNFVDPSGLMPCVAGDIHPMCDSSGFGGWGGGVNMNDRRSPTPSTLTGPNRTNFGTGGNSGRETIQFAISQDILVWAIFVGFQYTDAEGGEHVRFQWEKNAWTTPSFFSGGSWSPLTSGLAKLGLGNGAQRSATPVSGTRKGYWQGFADCMNDYRFDNLVRDIGTSAGYPGAGDFAASLTVTGTVAALANQGLNLTRLGKYPRQGIGGPAGSATSWQHRVGGMISRAVKMPSIGSVAKLVGRGAARASGVLIAFEAGYEVGNAIVCAGRR